DVLRRKLHPIIVWPKRSIGYSADPKLFVADKQKFAVHSRSPQLLKGLRHSILCFRGAVFERLGCIEWRDPGLFDRRDTHTHSNLAASWRTAPPKGWRACLSCHVHAVFTI